MIYGEGSQELQAGDIEAASFEELTEMAIAALRKQGESGIVCGPIATGGAHNQVYNLQIFDAAKDGLQGEGESVFPHLLYKPGLSKLAQAWEAEGNTGYCMPILDVFYAGLFETGLITRGWFIPGWNSSPDIRYKRGRLAMHGAFIFDLTREEIHSFLLQRFTTHQAAKMLASLALY